MMSRGFRIPLDYDVHQLVQRREPTKVECLKKELQELRLKVDPPKTAFVNSLCALPFDRSLYMVPFPRDIEVPKYDKYDGNSDPNDHVRHFYALSMTLFMKTHIY